MINHRIDLTVTNDQFTAIDTHLATLEADCAFLRGLSHSERSRVRGIGQGNEPFTFRAVEAGRANLLLMPRSLDVERMERDRGTREELLKRYERVRRLAEQFEDTIALLGADLFTGALAVYRALKPYGAAQGLDGLLDDLSQRFDRGPRKAETPSAKATPATQAQA